MNPIETHEKNLAWIDTRIRLATQLDALAARILINSLTANRAVLERHGPRNEFCDSCSRSAGRGITFPCQTYTDVRDGLGISE